MGNHKDPETLKLIEELRKEGERLGFKATPELPIMDRDYFIDLIMSPYNESHSSYLTFEVESKDNERIYKNFDKIFDLPAKDMEKPYYHFIIVIHGQLTRGDRNLLLEKARNKNAFVFEDVANKPESRKQLFDELRKFEIPIDGLIEKRGIIDKPTTVNEALCGLGKITPVRIIKNLKPVELSIDYKENGAISGLIQGPTASVYKRNKYSKTALVSIPPTEYTLVLQGTKIAFGVFVEKTHEDSKSINVIVEACDYPFKFLFELKKPNSAKVELDIDTTQADVVQLKLFEDIRAEMRKNKPLVIYYQNGKIKLRADDAMPFSEAYSDNWYSLVSDLAFISQSIKQKIPAPKNLVITIAEKRDIDRFKSIITTGMVDVELSSFTFRTKIDTIKELITLQKANGSISNLSFTNSETFDTLLDQKFNMGISIFNFPNKMIFKSSLEEIEKDITKTDTDALVEQTIIPTEDNKAHAFFLNWFDKQQSVNKVP